MSQPSYLTAEGAERLNKELDYLKNTARPQLSERLHIAIEQGDLSENADYITAKEEQGFLEGRIQELEAILGDVVIIDELEQNLEVISIGDRVTIQEDNLPPEIFQIVGPKEADPLRGRISHESPIGHALLGHKVGDRVTTETPDGTFSFIVQKIE